MSSYYLVQFPNQEASGLFEQIRSEASEFVERNVIFPDPDPTFSECPDLQGSKHTVSYYPGMCTVYTVPTCQELVLFVLCSKDIVGMSVLGKYYIP